MNDTELRALEYLRAALPTADAISLDDGFLLRVIRRALNVRAKSAWGSAIPDSVFFCYVMFPRVNNEDIVFYQEIIGSELEPRVKGKSMCEAAKEVNFYCYEKATYQSTDLRTANPLTVIKRAYGRCGEESVLLVSALRSVCIPARIVYVPRWSHCDDNHAWTEAWIDGKWRYMGSCEPEMTLDSGWFTSAASKAMLVHAKAYGINPENERVESKIGTAYIINRTNAYAKTREIKVKVISGGKPLKGVRTSFEIINMSELYPINEKLTDENGEAKLLTGLGTLWISVSDGERYIERGIDVSKESQITVDFDDATEFDESPFEIRQRPPLETRIQSRESSQAESLEHEKRLRQSEAVRAAYEASFMTDDEYLADARGNFGEIKAFLDDESYAQNDKRALLSSLKPKDLCDATRNMLSDALESSLKYKSRYPYDVWVDGVLCPRVHNEFLSPIRKELRRLTGPYGNAREVWRDIETRVRLLDMTPETVIPDILSELKSGLGGALARDILFVATARAHGIASRLNPLTGEKEYYENGAYVTIDASREKNAKLILINLTGESMRYRDHFTVGELQNGRYRTLILDGLTIGKRAEIELAAGRYRILTCTRQIDGSIDARVFQTRVNAGSETVVELTVSDKRETDFIAKTQLPPLSAYSQNQLKELPRDDHEKAIYAFIAPGQEPTEHFLNELLDAKAELRDKGVRINLFIGSKGDAGNKKLLRVLDEVRPSNLFTRYDEATVIQWRKLLRAGDMRLPLAIAVNGAGEALFSFVNYNVGSVGSLIRLLNS